MRVKQLREILANLPDDMEVILQKDGEGNGYSPLVGYDTNCIYEPDTKWYGDVYQTSYSADDLDMDSDEWQEICSRPRCLVLEPIN